MTLRGVRGKNLQLAAAVVVGLLWSRGVMAQSTAGAVTTTEALSATTRLSFTFGTKQDTVWHGFIGLCVVALLFDVVLTAVFIFKTVYRPTKIFKPKPAPTNGATKTERFSNGAHNESPKRMKDHGVICDVSDLGSVSESNSEDSNEEMRGRGKYYRSVESVHVPVDENQVHSMVSDRLGIELVEVRTDKDLSVLNEDDDDHGQGEEEEDDRATPPPPPIDNDAAAAPRSHVNSASKSPQRNALSVQAGTPVQMDIPYERVTCGRRIGKGGVGSVYAGELEGVGPVALKKVSVVGEERLQNLAQEAKMMAALRHPHIVFLYGLTISPEEEEDMSLGRHNDRCAYLVMELCSGDVGSLIDNSPKVKDAAGGGDGSSGSSGGLYLADRMAIMQKIAQQVAETMEFVHSKHVIHRDLKPANILLKENNDIRIADFGLSKALSNEQNHNTVEIGTPAYMAPELIVGIQEVEDDVAEPVINVPKALDVYAFGILLWSLFMDIHPYPNLGAFQTIYQVKMMNLRPQIPETASAAMRSLLERCWTLEPEERPSFKDINLALAAIIANGEWVGQETDVKVFVD